MKKLFLIQSVFLLLLSAFNSFSQQANEHEIYWIDHKKLTWNDYLASPDMLDSSNSALTYYGLASSMKTKGDSLTITVRSIFDKNKSWIKPGDKSDSLLIHEQGHFDIAEIYARKLKQILKEAHLKRSTLSI